MDSTYAFGFENDEYKFWVDENVAVLKTKTDMFESLCDLEKSGNMMELYDWIEKDPVVKVLLMINEPGALGKQAYERFIKRIVNKDVEEGSLLDADMKLVRARQMNTFRSFVTKTIDYNKILVSGLHGNVVTPFFGLSLAADFRLATSDMEFALEHVKYNLHPSGALPFFLQRFISRSRALEILYMGGKIDSNEALELGLVNRIYESGNFEEDCIAFAKELCQLDQNVIKLTKKLTSNLKFELERYFDIEAKLIGF